MACKTPWVVVNKSLLSISLVYIEERRMAAAAVAPSLELAAFRLLLPKRMMNSGLYPPLAAQRGCPPSFVLLILLSLYLSILLIVVGRMLLCSLHLRFPLVS